jgi:hypothetical protein
VSECTEGFVKRRKRAGEVCASVEGVSDEAARVTTSEVARGAKRRTIHSFIHSTTTSSLFL